MAHNNDAAKTTATASTRLSMTEECILSLRLALGVSPTVPGRTANTIAWRSPCAAS